MIATRLSLYAEILGLYAGILALTTFLAPAPMIANAQQLTLLPISNADLPEDDTRPPPTVKQRSHFNRVARKTISLVPYPEAYFTQREAEFEIMSRTWQGRVRDDIDKKNLQQAAYSIATWDRHLKSDEGANAKPDEIRRSTKRLIAFHLAKAGLHEAKERWTDAKGEYLVIAQLWNGLGEYSWRAKEAELVADQISRFGSRTHEEQTQYKKTANEQLASNSPSDEQLNSFRQLQEEWFGTVSANHLVAIEKVAQQQRKTLLELINSSEKEGETVGQRRDEVQTAIDAAIRTHQLLLDRSRKLYTSSHPRYGDAEFAFGKLAFVADDYKAAEEHFQSASVAYASGGNAPPQVAVTSKLLRVWSFYSEASQYNYKQFRDASNNGDSTSFWPQVNEWWFGTDANARDMQLARFLEWLVSMRLHTHVDKEAIRCETIIRDLFLATRGRDSWQYRQARWRIGHLQRLSELTTEQKQQYQQSFESDRAAAALQQKGRFKQAEEKRLGAFELRERLVGVNPFDRSSWHQFQSEALARQKNHEGSIKAGEASIQTIEDVFGKRHPHLNWGVLDEKYRETPIRSLTEASAVWGRIAALRSKFFGPHHYYSVDARLSAESFRHQATLDASDYEELKIATAELSEIRSNISGGPYHAYSGNWIDLDQKKQRIEQLLETQTRLLVADDPEIISTTYDLARIHDTLGDFRTARKLYERTLELQKGSSGILHPITGSIVKSLTNHCQELGERDRIESLPDGILETIGYGIHWEYTARSLSIYVNPKEPAELEILREFRRCGRLMLNDEFLAAEQYARELIEKTKTVYDDTHALHAIAIANRAAALVMLGDYVQAHSLLEDSLEILGDGQENRYYASLVRHNVAVAYSRQRKDELALKETEEAWRLLVMAKENETVEAAQMLANWGLTLSQLGQFDDAQHKLADAAARFVSLKATRHPAYLESVNNGGRVALQRGDFESATALLELSLAGRKDMQLEQTDGHADLLHNFGALADAQDQREIAAENYQQALEITWRNVQAAAAIQSQRQQMAAVDAFRERLDSWLSLSQRAKTGGNAIAARRVYRHVFAWKGSSLMRNRHVMTALANAPQDSKAYAEAKLILSELEQVNLQIANQTFTLMVRKQEQEFENLTAKREELEARLGKTMRLFGSLSLPPDSTIIQLQQSLDAKTVLIDLLEYNHVVWGPNGRDQKPHRRLAAFVIRSDGLKQIDLGPAEPIRNAVKSWRMKFGHPAAYAEHPGQVLRDLVWLPLEDELHEDDVVLISPDGSLASLPFSALPGAQPDSWLVQERAIVLVPVPRLLVVGDRSTDLASRDDAQATPTLLTVGHVRYEKPDAPKSNQVKFLSPQLGEAVRNWPYLPGTLDEIYHVRKAFQSGHPEGHVLQLHSLRADEQALRMLAGEFEWLHFATHGFFLDTEGDARQQIDLRAYHPGVLAGLAVSGANTGNTETQYDNLLTALEVSSLDLGKTKLAALSACQTAQGEFRTGEGAISLQRAFHLAGARNVLSSLWQVPDRATERLMQEFYDNLWIEKLSMPEALRQAQCTLLSPETFDALEVKRGLRPLRENEQDQAGGATPPYFWAAFVLSTQDPHLNQVHSRKR